MKSYKWICCVCGQTLRGAMSGDYCTKCGVQHNSHNVRLTTQGNLEPRQRDRYASFGI